MFRAPISWKGHPVGTVEIATEDGTMKAYIGKEFGRHRPRILRELRKLRRKFTEAEDLTDLGEVRGRWVAVGAMEKTDGR